MLSASYCENIAGIVQQSPLWLQFVFWHRCNLSSRVCDCLSVWVMTILSKLAQKLGCQHQARAWYKKAEKQQAHSAAQLGCDSRRQLGSMSIPHRQLYIGGAWTKPAQGQTFDVFSPSSGSKLGTIPAATAEDVDRAVSAAVKAFQSGVWSKTSGAHRARFLRAIADKVCIRSKLDGYSSCCGRRARHCSNAHRTYHKLC